MRIIENDGTTLLVETVVPKWTVADVELRHQRRCLTALVEAKLIHLDDEALAWDEARQGFEPETQRYVNRPGLTKKAGQLINKLPAEVQDMIGRELTGDHRERIGRSRNDARPTERTTLRLPIDIWADRMGVRTTELGWVDATVQAVHDAPSIGVVQ
jgi:hypothetical protein